MKKITKNMGRKNCLIYVVFNFLIGIVLPIVIIIIGSLIVSLISSKITVAIFSLIFLLLALILYLTNDFLVCKIVKKMTGNTHSLGKIMFIFNLLTIILITLTLFSYTNDSIEIKKLLTTVFFSYLVLIIVKIVSYILVKKLYLKEKIPYHKVLLSITILYLIIITFGFYLIVPNDFSKFMFQVFGQTDFSSKELKIRLTDEYNKGYSNFYGNRYGNEYAPWYAYRLKNRVVSYFEEFSSQELKYFDTLKINDKVTNSDIKVGKGDLEKLRFLRSLEINNLKINELNLLENTKLEKLVINNSNIKNINLKNLKSVINIEINNSNISELNIKEGNLESISINNSKIDNFVIEGEKIKKVDVLKTKIEVLSIKDTTNLVYVNMKDSNIDEAILDNNKMFEENVFGKKYTYKYGEILHNLQFNLFLEKVNNIELKNIKDINQLFKNSTFVFKKISFSNDKQISLRNNEYLNKVGNNMYASKDTLVKEFNLENLKPVYYKYVPINTSLDIANFTREKLESIDNAALLPSEIEIYDGDRLLLLMYGK